MNFTIETKRLFLDILSTNDADFIFDLVNSPGWIKFIGDRNIKTSEDAQKYIQKILDNPNVTYWTVQLKDPSVSIGVITFIKRDYLDHHDIGFAFLPHYSKNGFAFEATQAILNKESESGLHKSILATTLIDNASSIALLKKLGLEFEKEILVETERLLLFSKEVK